MAEIWKYIEGTEQKYMISNYGNVKSLCNHKERLLTITTQKSGYNYVMLQINGKAKNYRLHRLVAMAFVPNPNGYKEINHIDGDKANNRADNLEWVTRKYNCNYSYKVLGKKRKPMSEEQKQYLRDLWKGKKRDADHREKTRQGLLRYYQRLREQRNNERQTKKLH